MVTVQGQLNCFSDFFQIVAFDLAFASDGNSQSCKLENRQIDKVLVPTIDFRIGSLSRSSISSNSALGKNIDWSDSQIEICKIVSGKGQGSYNPHDPITGSVKHEDG